MRRIKRPGQKTFPLPGDSRGTFVYRPFCACVFYMGVDVGEKKRQRVRLFTRKSCAWSLRRGGGGLKEAHGRSASQRLNSRSTPHHRPESPSPPLFFWAFLLVRPSAWIPSLSFSLLVVLLCLHLLRFSVLLFLCNTVCINFKRILPPFFFLPGLTETFDILLLSPRPVIYYSLCLNVYSSESARVGFKSFNRNWFK